MHVQRKANSNKTEYKSNFQLIKNRHGRVQSYTVIN